MTIRRYSSVSQETYLTTAINTTSTTMTVNSALVLGSITPSVGERFTLVIDPDTALEEIVYAVSPSSPSSTTLTIIRGVDGTGVEGVSGIAHSAGAKVRHMAIGVDFREANNHIEQTTGTAHGLVLANVVKTTDTGTVANGMIAANAVTTAKIADLNVTSAKIADSAITSGKIADLAVGTADIADLAVTSGKIATGAVGTTKIDDAAVVEAKIGTAAVTTTKIADLNVTTGKIADSAVTSAKIADGTIVAGDIADGAITSAKILDGTIVSTDLADGAVTSGKILDGTIVNADVNSSAQIGYSKLNLTNTIVNADISAAAAIPMSKLAVDPTARANHTGTQLASTISNFDTQVRTSKVTDLAAPTTSVSVNSQKITDLGTPTLSTDAATKAYADLMIPLSQKGVANGVAELDASGLVPTHHLPALAISTTQVVASEVAMLALTAQVGDVAVRTDLNKTFILSATPPSTLANWQELLTPTDAVLSVDGRIGAVTLGDLYGSVASVAAKLPLAGGTMSGAIAMGTNKITGLGDPTAAQDAATKNYIDTVVLAPSNLVGPITSVGNVTSIASQTGTGTKFVVDTSPTLVTPELGVATATSINGTTIPTSKTLVATDSTTYVVPSQTSNSGKFLTTNGTTSSWAGAVSTDGGSTITVPSGTTVPLTIQNNGTGNSFVVNDVASDTTPFIIGDGGATYIGTPAAYSASGISSPLVNVASEDPGAGIAMSNWTGASSAASNIQLIKSRGAAVGTRAAVVNSDQLGIFRFSGDDGTNFISSSRIVGAVDGTVSTGVVPGRLAFETASTAGALTERMRIATNGQILANTTTSNGPNVEVVNFNSNNGTIVARGASATDSVFIHAQSNTYYSTPSFTMTGIGQHGASATGTTGGISNANLGILSFQNTGNALIQTNNPVPLIFGTNNTERMRIDSTGSTTINAIAGGTTTTAAVGAGYMGLPQNTTTTGAYTVVAADAGKHIYSTATRTVTINSNANLALPIGTTLTFVAAAGATVTIAITTDTLLLAGAGTTGSRTLAAHGMATAVKITATSWIISGNGLT